MKRVKTGLILLFSLAVPLVHAASFDCNKAQTKVETLICAFPPLGEADEQLGQLYTQALKSLPTSPATQLREEQRAWLEQRDQQLLTACVDNDCLTQRQTLNTCFDVDCAVKFYAERIALLKGDTPSTASFDCAKAHTAVEKMICAHPPLGEADKHLAEVYALIKEQMPTEDIKMLQTEQIAWLKERDEQMMQCAGDVDCVVAIYEDRVSALLQLQTDPHNYEDTSTIVGSYALAEYMSLQVKSLVHDHVLIDVEGAEPTEGKWLCHFSGVGTLIEDTVTMCHPEQNTPITFTFSENAVSVNGEHLDYFCGRGMTIAGQYKKRSLTN